MEFAVDLNLIRSQKLLPTPQLKQAIEIRNGFTELFNTWMIN